MRRRTNSSSLDLFVRRPGCTPAIPSARCICRLSEHITPRQLEHVARQLAYGRDGWVEQVGQQGAPECVRPRAYAVGRNDELRAAVRLPQSWRLSQGGPGLARPSMRLGEHLDVPRTPAVPPALLEVIEGAIDAAGGRGGLEIHRAQLGGGGGAPVVPRDPVAV